MLIQSLFKTKFVGVKELNGDVLNLTIRTVRQEKVARELKTICVFGQKNENGQEYAIALNQETAFQIAALHGPDTAQWPGKKITLVIDYVEMRGEQIEAVRVSELVPDFDDSDIVIPKTAPIRRAATPRIATT